MRYTGELKSLNKLAGGAEQRCRHAPLPLVVNSRPEEPPVIARPCSVVPEFGLCASSERSCASRGACNSALW